MTERDFRSSEDLDDFQKLPEPQEGERNPYNSLTRADTFGIRPDLFFKLSEITPSRPEMDALMRKQEENAQKAEDIASDISGMVTKADFSEYDSDLQARLWGEQGEFNEITAAFQRQQTEIDEQQNKFIELLQQVQQEAERRRPRPVYAKFSEYKDGYVDPEGFVRISPYSTGDRGFLLEALGSWTGTIIIRALTLDGFLNFGSMSTIRVPVTPNDRVWNGTPENLSHTFNTLDLTIFPD